jgi:hypothetical protein
VEKKMPTITISKILMTVMILISIFISACGTREISYPTSVPAEVVSPGFSLQERVFVRAQYLVHEITQNSLARTDIKEYLTDCKYYMQEVESRAQYDLNGSKCLILVASEVPADGTIAVTNSTFNMKGDIVSFAILYPWELSDETWTRILYHEAVHMVDYIKNPVCQEEEVRCQLDDEFEAHSETSVLFKEYLNRNGFSDEEIKNFNPDNMNDKIVQFGYENSISQVEYEIFVQDTLFLRENLKGNFYNFLSSIFVP